MFIGEYYHKLDEKNRLGIPIKFRKTLGKEFIITRGLDKCLFVYTSIEWKNLINNKLNNLSFSQADARGFSRIMFTGAMKVNLDTFGRIIIPDFLKKYANLTKNIAITGVYNRLEIWDEKTWHKYRKGIEEKFEDIAEKIDI